MKVSLICLEYFAAVYVLINILTETLKWRLMLRQMRENMLRQMKHVSVATDKKVIPFFIGPDDVVRYDVV